MDQKLHERDLQLKQMIAELQKKFSSGKYVVYGEGEGKKPYLGEQVEIDSDYSIDSM